MSECNVSSAKEKQLQPKRQHDHDKPKSSSGTPMTQRMTTLNDMLQLLPSDVDASMDFSQIELRYRAEGNANLVLALPQFRKVLRLPKMSSNTTALNLITAATKRATDHDNNIKQQQEPQELQSTSGIVERELQDPKGSVPHPNVFFASADDKLSMADYVGYIDVVRRLLGHEFVLTAEIIEIVSEEQRMWINESIRPHRPAQRLDKEFCGHFGLVLPDVTLLPGANNLQATPPHYRTSGNIYAIEIKPKQGWLLPSPSDVNDDLFHMQQTTTKSTAHTATISCRTSAARKLTTRCRYCTMQYLKLKNSKITKRSSYCPIELFSGQPLRMLVALSSLFECPQNNLRVFQNGNLIYGDHATSISWNELKQQVFKGDMLQIVQHLLVTCLLRDYEQTPTSTQFQRKMSSEETTTVVEIVTGQPHSTAKAPPSPPPPPPQSGTLKKTATEMLKTEIELDDIVAEVTSDKVGDSADQERFQKKKPRLELATTAMASGATASMALEEVETQAQITDAELLCLPKNCVLHKILHLQLLAKHNLRYMSASELANETGKSYQILRSLLDMPTAEVSFELLTPTQQYLLSATALDCSVMITFQELQDTVEGQSLTFDSHVVHLAEFNKTFRTKVTILDLDPKPDSHFNKFVQQTQQAYECFIECLGKGE